MENKVAESKTEIKTRTREIKLRFRSINVHGFIIIVPYVPPVQYDTGGQATRVTTLMVTY